jgi:hypothetical protein
MTHTIPWQVGDQAKVTGYFTDVSGALVDPATVTVKIKNPAGSVQTLVYNTDLEVVRDSVGVYHVLIDLTSSGNWFYRFAGSGTHIVANEGTLSVQISAF